MASLLDLYLQHHFNSPGSPQQVQAGLLAGAGPPGPSPAPATSLLSASDMPAPSILDGLPKGMTPSAYGALARRRTGLPSPNMAGPAPAVPQQAIQGRSAPPVASGSGHPLEGQGTQDNSFFSRLFVGDPEIRGKLGKKKTQELRKQGLLTAGLMTLAQVGNTDVSFPRAMALGILAGRRAATQTAGQLLDERRAQERLMRYNAALTNPDMTELERMETLRDLAMKNGDTESAKLAESVVKDLRDLPEGSDNRKFKVVNGQGVWVDESAGKVYDLAGNVIREIPKAEGPATGDFKFAQKVYNPDTKKYEMWGYSPSSNRFQKIPGKGFQTHGAPQLTSQQLIQLPALLTAEQDLSKTESQVGFQSVLAGDEAGWRQYLNSNAGRRYQAAARRWTDSYMSFAAGRKSAFIYRQYLHAFTVQGTDDPATRAEKLQARRTVSKAISAVARGEMTPDVVDQIVAAEGHALTGDPPVQVDVGAARDVMEGGGS